MTRDEFTARLKALFDEHEQLVTRMNQRLPKGNGVFERYMYPVVTAEHTPPFWRYDLNHATNPHLLERLGVAAEPGNASAHNALAMAL